MQSEPESETLYVRMKNCKPERVTRAETTLHGASRDLFAFGAFA